MAPTEGNAASGTVVFTQQEGSLKVTVNLSGFAPGSSHGFHVHETGDCSAPDGSSAGGHYNPEGHDHHMPPDEPRHAGHAAVRQPGHTMRLPSKDLITKDNQVSFRSF